MAGRLTSFADLVSSLPSLAGKTIAITGCTSGIGLVLARTSARLGAEVLMLNRPSARADAALKMLTDSGATANSVACDLQSFDSVRAAAAYLRAHHPRGIDVLCNNAGVMGLPDKATPDGFDVQMQPNHLSHFLLTSAIWSLLEVAASTRGEARVVNHSSGARRGAALDARYLRRNGGKLGGDWFPGFAKWKRYQQSKLANLLFTYALHDRVAKDRRDFADRIKSVCAHPGPTDSGLQAKTTEAGGKSWLDRYLISRTLKAAHSVEEGTMGIATACWAPHVASLDFYGPAGRGKAGPAVLLPRERNVSGEDLLWRESLRSTGVTAFFG